MPIPEHPGEPVEEPVTATEVIVAQGLNLDPMVGVSAQGAMKNARQMVKKQAQDRVNRFVRGLMTDHHNLKMKATRLHQEAAAAEAQLGAIEEKLGRINAGDLSDMEPFEISLGDNK